MIQVAAGTRVYLACRPVSMRYGFDGLAAQVALILGADPFLCVSHDYAATPPKAGSFQVVRPKHSYIITHRVTLNSGAHGRQHFSRELKRSQTYLDRCYKYLECGLRVEEAERVVPFGKKTDPLQACLGCTASVLPNLTIMWRQT